MNASIQCPIIQLLQKLMGLRKNIFSGCRVHSILPGSLRKTMVLILLSIFSTFALAVPTITDFNPKSGKIGTKVTITGTNFSTTSANNIVYFGGMRAQVVWCSSISLIVIVPTGSTYQPITLTVSGLTAYSKAPFLVTAPCGGDSLGTLLEAKIDFATGTYPHSVVICDVDGDRNPDLIVSNYTNNTVSVFRNTSTIGSVSFASRIDYSTANYPKKIAFGDIDGDGKLDFALTCADSIGLVSIYRNTSTSGSVSFAPRVDFITLDKPRGVAINDLDGDGKPDVVLVNENSGMVSIFRNTSPSGGVSFASRIDLTTGNGPLDVAIGDIDGDGKSDLAVTNSSVGLVAIYRNTSTVGTVSFATSVNFTAGSYPSDIEISDLDGDNKLDVTVTNKGSNSISVLRNISTVGTVNFGSRVDFTTGDYPIGLAIGDMDGDGRPDAATANYNGSTVSILKNVSMIGSVSFLVKVDFTSGSVPVDVAIGDLDGNHRPDVTVTNSSSNTFSVLMNANNPLLISMCTGWNLVSVPLVQTDYTGDIIFPSVWGDLYWYIPCGGYVPVTTLELGKGYWASYPVTITNEICGTCEGPVTITAGVNCWNLVGSCKTPIDVSSLVFSDGASAFGGIAYEYPCGGGGYIPTPVINPGQGVWIYVVGTTTDCTITLPCCP